MDDKANKLVAKLCALCQELKNIDFAVEEPISEDTLCDIILKEIQRVKYKYDECRGEFLESNLFHSGFNDVDIDFKRIFFEAMGKLVKYRKNDI